MHRITGVNDTTRRSAAVAVTPAGRVPVVLPRPVHRITADLEPVVGVRRVTNGLSSHRDHRLSGELTTLIRAEAPLVFRFDCVSSARTLSRTSTPTYRIPAQLRWRIPASLDSDPAGAPSAGGAPGASSRPGPASDEAARPTSGHGPAPRRKLSDRLGRVWAASLATPRFHRLPGRKSSTPGLVDAPSPTADLSAGLGADTAAAVAAPVAEPSGRVAARTESSTAEPTRATDSPSLTIPEIDEPAASEPQKPTDPAAGAASVRRPEPAGDVLEPVDPSAIVCVPRPPTPTSVSVIPAGPTTPWRSVLRSFRWVAAARAALRRRLRSEPRRAHEGVPDRRGPLPWPASRQTSPTLDTRLAAGTPMRTDTATGSFRATGSGMVPAQSATADTGTTASRTVGADTAPAASTATSSTDPASGSAANAGTGAGSTGAATATGTSVSDSTSTAGSGSWGALRQGSDVVPPQDQPGAVRRGRPAAAAGDRHPVAAPTALGRADARTAVPHVSEAPPTQGIDQRQAPSEAATTDHVTVRPLGHAHPTPCRSGTEPLSGPSAEARPERGAGDPVPPSTEAVPSDGAGRADITSAASRPVLPLARRHRHGGAVGPGTRSASSDGSGTPAEDVPPQPIVKAAEPHTAATGGTNAMRERPVARSSRPRHSTAAPVHQVTDGQGRVPAEEQQSAVPDSPETPGTALLAAAGSSARTSGPTAAGETVRADGASPAAHAALPAPRRRGVTAPRPGARGEAEGARTPGANVHQTTPAPAPAPAVQKAMGAPAPTPSAVRTQADAPSPGAAPAPPRAGTGPSASVVSARIGGAAADASRSAPATHRSAYGSADAPSREALVERASGHDSVERGRTGRPGRSASPATAPHRKAGQKANRKPGPKPGREPGQNPGRQPIRRQEQPAPGRPDNAADAAPRERPGVVPAALILSSAMPYPPGPARAVTPMAPFARGAVQRGPRAAEHTLSTPPAALRNTTGAGVPERGAWTGTSRADIRLPAPAPALAPATSRRGPLMLGESVPCSWILTLSGSTGRPHSPEPAPDTELFRPPGFCDGHAVFRPIATRAPQVESYDVSDVVEHVGQTAQWGVPPGMPSPEEEESS